MEIVPISSLSPSSALPTECGFKALVTLLWPFSSATEQCALLLADPDARQRYLKGQVRVRFTGPSAHQIATSGVGIGDSVQVALVGAQWLTGSDAALVKTPGKGVDGELMFKNRLHMIIKRGENEPRTIHVDESTQPTSPKLSMLPPSTPIARSKPRTSFDAYGVAVYSSPAFMKRLRLSEGGTPYSPLPVSEDDDLNTVASRKRRRFSYKNVSEWKFDAREPSPEKEQDDSLEDVGGAEDLVTETRAKETATVDTGNVIQRSQDQDMQDAVEVTEKVGQQVEQPDPEVESTQANTAQPPQEVVAQGPPVEAAGTELVETEAHSGSAAKPSNVQEPEEEIARAAVQRRAEATRLEGTISEGSSQGLESSAAFLPRLTILPTEGELLERMARAQNIDRPSTPILQPLLTESLPLPSPFPTSAQKMPSPVFPNAEDALEIPRKETAVEEATGIDAITSDTPRATQKSSPAPESRVQQAPGNAMVELQESMPSSRIVKESTDPVQRESSQQVEATIQKPRIVADMYDGYAEEVPVVLSSDGENNDDDDANEAESLNSSQPVGSSPVLEAVQLGWRSRGGRFDDESSADGESDEDMESSSGESASDDASSVYNSEQIVALQEESDHEGAIEEPDWDYLERKLEQEEAALQQSREDLSARDRELIETADDLQGDEADDAVMHDDNSELDEDMLVRSDDDSADDSDGSGYFDRAVMPDTEEESSGDSEVEMMDQSYQPSMPENAMYSHPFGLDGAHTSTGTKTELPSQAASETGSVMEDETIAWRDRDAAVEALGQQVQKAQPQATEQAARAPQTQHAPPPPPSRLEVVELLDDSDSEEEDENTTAPLLPETIDFLPSISHISRLLNNKEKDAHLELTGPVTAQIRSEIRNVSAQVNRQSAKSTKFNALKTICKIGVNVAVAADNGNMFAEGVKYRLKEDEVLVNACWKIYNELSNEERHHTSQPLDLLVCLEELEEKRDYCFEGFTNFLKHFRENYYHMPVEAKQQQLHQQNAPMLPKVEARSAQEVELQPTSNDRNDEQGPAARAVENQNDPASVDATTEQPNSPAAADPVDKTTELSENPRIESQDEATTETDVDLTALPRTDLSQDLPVSVEDLSPSQFQSIEEDIESQSEADEEEPEVMEMEADSVESITEHEIDPALLEEEHEIDPTLLDEENEVDSSQSEAYEIDPALLQEGHEIDPALLADGHDDLQSNGYPSPEQVDETMSEAPEPDAFSFVDDEASDQRSVREAVTIALDESMTDEPSAPHVDEEPVAQAEEALLKSEVQESVEIDPENVEPLEMEATETFPASASETENVQQVKEEARPLSSSSFRTLSPTPDVAQVQKPKNDAHAAAQDSSHAASQVPDQPIEELDLSQVEPSWTSRFSQFSQSRSSRAHTRSETIPDSADEEVKDLVAESSGTSSRSASAEEATRASPSQGTQKQSRENAVQASQELGTAFSQFPKQAHGPSGLQSQFAAMEETPPPEEGEAAEETRSQFGLDDELLADYVQVIPEEAPTPSRLQSVPSTPTSTKKPARPLTLFRGRKSVGSRLSIGEDKQQTGEAGQQIRDNEQQAVQDEVMQDVPFHEPEVSVAAEEMTKGITEGEKQVQNEDDPPLISVSSVAPEAQPHTAEKPQAAMETETATAAPESEPSTTVEQSQVSEKEQATSNLQLQPTLKPFAEVEASLFGTPIKNKNATPQEPQSAPSQTWRNALSSKMSEVPVIGSWFTPRRTTVVQKAATEHKAATTSTSLVEETPTKVAAVPLAKQSSRDRQKSISPPPLQRYASQGTSTSLSYFTPLAGLHQHLNQQSSLIDIVAVCTTNTTAAERAKSGPKDYYTTFRIVDQPLYEYSAASRDTAETESVKEVNVEIFRPFKQSLPQASPGDVVLLRGFVVRSRKHKNYLLSTAASGWCVWRYGQPSSTSNSLDYEGQEEEEEDDRPVWARKGNSQRVGEDGVKEEITGPPVEVGDGEREKVSMLRTWWEGLQKEKKKGEGEQETRDVIMID